ncbi:phage tail protein [Desulfovibrio subterraneus]|uniref:phage tail protein n=1 Tax=Desulfovibrio subterraneus TaxID=2718620 RepID=UPI0022B8966A|nr:phage tail protein [Desulfovibrio subterraneus]WBF68246.1 phage tail protein [Desulfovibrio subterraneus]
MATVITLAGESLIARKQAAGEPLQIDAFVLALVPGLDPDLPVDRSEGKPDAAQIVHTYQIPDEYRGYVNPNQVVYSMLLGSDLGNFSFNWLGLYSSVDDVVVAISHLPEMAKWKTDTATNAAGNNLTRNMLLEFSGAQVATGITIQAATWQVDFTARMRGIDARERRSNRDIYGRACFFADAAKVVNNAGAFSLQAGTLYVEGVRVAFAAMPLEAGSLPKKVWLDVGLVQQGADMVADMAVTVLPPEQAAPDYADAVGNARYRVALAEIAADGTVTDLRRTEGVVTDLVAYLLARIEEQGTDEEALAALRADLQALADQVAQNNQGKVGRSEFSFIAEDNGRFIFPVVGGGQRFMLQWGVKDYTGTARNADIPVTFPIAFPNACLNVLTERKTNTYAPAGSVDSFAAYAYTPTGFQFQFENSTAAAAAEGSVMVWFAIGF